MKISNLGILVAISHGIIAAHTHHCSTTIILWREIISPWIWVVPWL